MRVRPKARAVADDAGVEARTGGAEAERKCRDADGEEHED